MTLSGMLKALRNSPEGSRVGIDMGSRSVKAAVMTDAGTSLFITDTTELLADIDGVKVGPGVELVSTGYGRKLVSARRSIPEVRAHALGAAKALDLTTFTLLDIGGQDMKVIRVEGSVLRDFSMNDKCAAGTGRFLEKMASMLGMSVQELSSHKGGRKLLESTCSVFTETEIIDLLVRKVPRDEIASGVVHSVYERVRPHLRAFPLDVLVFTGGVSLGRGLRETLEEGLGIEVMVPPDPQFTGAIGCTLAMTERSRVQGRPQPLR